LGCSRILKPSSRDQGGAESERQEGGEKIPHPVSGEKKVLFAQIPVPNPPHLGQEWSKGCALSRKIRFFKHIKKKEKLWWGEKASFRKTSAKEKEG